MVQKVTLAFNIRDLLWIRSYYVFSENDFEPFAFYLDSVAVKGELAEVGAERFEGLALT